MSLSYEITSLLAHEGMEMLKQLRPMFSVKWLYMFFLKYVKKSQLRK